MVNASQTKLEEISFDPPDPAQDGFFALFRHTSRRHFFYTPEMENVVVMNAVIAAMSDAFDGKDGEDWFEGLTPTLGAMSAETASQQAAPGRSSIAAHVRHLVYTLETVNAWFSGQRPALDWTAAWQSPGVSADEWAALKTQLELQRRALEEKLRANEHPSQEFLESAIKNVSHLGYHVGAIRQMRVALN
jgi:DinB superfamily